MTIDSNKQKEPLVHPLVLVLIAVSLGAAGQILLKQGMGGVEITGPLGRQGRILLRAILTPYVFLGITLYAVSTLFWLKVLTTQELSYVYPMIAVSYVMVTILSIIFLQERVNPMRWLALVVICAGVAMLAIWGNNKAKSGETKAPTAEVQSPQSDART
jgi:drug/metabolite transporter (DMT)-like permease